MSPKAAPSLGLRALLWPYLKQALVGAGLLAATNLLDKTLPWLLKDAIDALRAQQLTQVMWLAGYVVAIAALLWVVRTASRMVVFHIGRRAEFDLRNRLVAKLTRIDEAVVAQFGSGEIMTRATGDMGNVRALIGFGGLNLVNTVLAFGLALALMLTLSPELTLWAMLPYPGFVLVARTLARGLFVRSRAIQDTSGALSTRLENFIRGLRIQRTYGLEVEEFARFRALNQQLLGRHIDLVKLRAVLWPLLTTLTAMGTLLVVWRGGRMVIAGELSIGEFVAFNAYLGQLVWPSMAVGFLLAVLQRGRASLARLAEIIEAPDTPRGEAIPGHPLRLEAEALRFRYPGAPEDTLRGLTLALPERGLVAVVGRSGSGKSTLAALLAGRLLPSGGTLHFGAVPVGELSEQALAETLTYCPQDAQLFSTTLRRNLLVAKPDATQAELEDALTRAALATDLDQLPQGLDTLVGERGVQLSGGQKQRLTVARCLLRPRPLMIFDDPISAVDAETEQRLVGSLRALAEEALVLLVTHRVSASAVAEQVLVLEAGELVEQGTHATLCTAGGRYAQLAERQAHEAALGAA